jgi:hypothetical protein
LIPVLWLFALTGLIQVASFLRVSERSAGHLLKAIFALLLFWQLGTNGFAGIKNIRTIRTLHGEPAWHPSRYEITGELDFSDQLACGLWLAEHTSPNALVYGEKAAFLALSSGRHAFYMNQLFNILEEERPSEGSAERYVVVDIFPEKAGYGRPKLEFLDLMNRQSAPDYEMVFQAPHGARVFRQRGGGQE